MVTDNELNVLGLPPGNEVNFEGAGVGECWVWSLSFTGDLNFGMGDNVGNFLENLSSDCFDLSSTFVTVFRDTPESGEPTAVGGATTVYTCPGDGNDDVLAFEVTGNSASNLQLVVTDNELNVLGLPPGNEVNFEGAGVGECWVWSLSFTGDLNFGMGDNVGNFLENLSSDCFDLSSTFVTVFRDTPESGEPTAVGGATTVYTCPGDGNDDVLAFEVTGNSASNLQLVVTDNELNVLGLPPGNEVNFEGAGVGECWVWSLSFTGDLNFGMGDNVGNFLENLSSDCFDLSSTFVTVFRDTPESGEPTAVGGATTVYTCPGDGNDDVLAFEVTGNSASNLQLVVTDNELNVLGLPPGNEVNFEGAGVGECWVWSLSFTGDLNFGMGDNVGNFLENLSSDCFDLSSTFVTVFRDEPNGGMVTTIDGATEVTITAGDGMDDIIEFASTGTSNSRFTYVITDDNNVILGIPPSNSQNFEGAGAGVCRVWGLSYTGEITAVVGDNAATTDLSSDCFDLSENFITVTRNAPLGPIGTSSLNLQPNPAQDQIQLNFDLEFAPELPVSTITVYSLNGEIVFNGRMETYKGFNQFQLDTSYRVQLVNGKEIQTNFCEIE